MYSTFDRELLALYIGNIHFRYLLEGRHFAAFTDHKQLGFAMVQTTDPCSARQQRHLAFISEFTTDIQHLPGKDNVVADCLSYSTINAVSLGRDYTTMEAAQIEDEDVQACPTAITNLYLKNMPVYPNVQ